MTLQDEFEARGRMLKDQFDAELRPELDRYLAMPDAPRMPQVIDNLPRVGPQRDTFDAEAARWAANPDPTRQVIDVRKVTA